MPSNPSPTGTPLAREAVLPPAFECSWTHGGLDAAWVRVVGELDSATAPQLEWTLRAAHSQAALVVLDLRDLAFMGSAGVHAIVGASARARRAGRRLVALRGHPHVDRVLALTGAHDQVEIVDLDPGEPAVQALLKLADPNLAS